MIAAFLITAALFAEATVGAGPAQSDIQSQTPSANPAASKAKPEDPMVCKYEPVLGSRFSTRTCLRKSVRDEMALRAREATQNVQSKSLGPWIEKP